MHNPLSWFLTTPSWLFSWLTKRRLERTWLAKISLISIHLFWQSENLRPVIAWLKCKLHFDFWSSNAISMPDRPLQPPRHKAIGISRSNSFQQQTGMGVPHSWQGGGSGGNLEWQKATQGFARSRVEGSRAIANFYLLLDPRFKSSTILRKQTSNSFDHGRLNLTTTLQNHMAFFTSNLL